MSLLATFDTKNNFWEVNPQLTIPAAFNKLRKEDKSKDKVNSSQIMWAIAFVCEPDPEHNKFANIPEEDRKELIAKDFLNESTFNWEAYKEQLDLYTSLVLTPAEKSLKTFIKKITEREQFLDKTEYSLGTIDRRSGRYTGGTADLIDKMMLHTKKIYDEYERIKEALEKEKSAAVNKGNREISLTDSGEI